MRRLRAVAVVPLLLVDAALYAFGVDCRRLDRLITRLAP